MYAEMETDPLSHEPLIIILVVIVEPDCVHLLPHSSLTGKICCGGMACLQPTLFLDWGLYCGGIASLVSH
ncbi:hypothetical protein COCNU_contig69429885G000010 [Cocos nucifera]|nr:hypothetical protein [Cocos nucifera]